MRSGSHADLTIDVTYSNEKGVHLEAASHSCDRGFV